MKARSRMELNECFRLLGVEAGAEWAEIRKSFHRLARQYHPDCNSGDRATEERFKAISIAYETLEQWHQSRQFSYRVYAPVVPAHNDKGSSSEAHEGFTDKGEIYEESRPQSWKEWLGTRLQQYEQKWLDLNIEKEVTIEPETAQRGGTLRIQNATGGFLVLVPQGTPEGTVLRIPGKGEAGLFHTVRGDLLLRIKVRPPRRETSGVTEFFYQVKVSSDSLQNPGIRTLHTHEGPLRYRLPRNVKDGQSFSLKSRPDPSTGQTHHHIVVVDYL